MNKIERIKELVNTLVEACNSYYVNDNPIMTDKQYDLLYDELSQLEVETNYILSNSQSTRKCS